MDSAIQNLQNEEREFFQQLNTQVGRLVREHSKEITWELLEYGRGKIFNYCISHEEGDDTWYSQALQKTMRYFHFLLNDIRQETSGLDVEGRK